MVESYHQSGDALQAFHKWRRSPRAQSLGIRGPDFETTCPFIPRSNLEEYLGRPHQVENLLDAVLDSHSRPGVVAQYVRDHYLQSFAILLCIGEGSMITHFQQFDSLQDQKLPHRTRPEDFPFITPDKFEDFKKEQWQFCAPSLKYNMNGHFRGEEIIPIILKQRIGEGGSAIIYKIVVHERYNSLRPRGHAIPECRPQHENTFVLKTYRKTDAPENYKAERDAYMNLRWGNLPPPHIISYYGGFVHGDSYNTILQYADQGTLEDFMRTTDPPSTFEDNILVWDRLFDVTNGIMAIHGNPANHGRASQILNGWHQDVKPANILVLRGSGASPYDCHFMVADLGHTHFKPSVSQQNEPSDLDAFGTRAYGAPETFRSHNDTESCPLQVTPLVDIWSIGCVFSEFSVWDHSGWNAVLEYRRRRSAEIRANGGGRGEHTFHNDTKLLAAVENTHSSMLEGHDVVHHITRLVLGHLVGDMLQHGTRPGTKFVFEKSKRLIKDTAKQFGVPADRLARNLDGDLINSNDANVTGGGPTQGRSGQNHIGSQSSSRRRDGSAADRALLPVAPRPPDDDSESTSRSSQSPSIGASGIPGPGGHPSHVVTDPSSPPSTAVNTSQVSGQQPVQQRREDPARPTLSIHEGHKWKKKRKNGGETSPLCGEENLTSLDQRDHIFLIDSSKTMEQYSKDIKRVVSLLAYMVKNSDKDGLDIHFTQTVRKLNSRRSSKLSKSICETDFIGISDMRAGLHRVLQDRSPPIGQQNQPPRLWYGRQRPPQPHRPLSLYILTDAKWQPTDVGGVIKSLVQRMIDAGCPKEHVAIQFIRFGNDEASIGKLDDLDCKLGLKADGMDIVDHTYWDGNVWKQLLGALNDWYDDDPI